jgi:Xaa-Pro aminopeptidase
MLTPQDLEPNWEWRDRLPAWGHTSVDFERRIDHDRLRRYRLARTRQSPAGVECGFALLL